MSMERRVQEKENVPFCPLRLIFGNSTHLSLLNRGQTSEKTGGYFSKQPAMAEGKKIYGK